MAGRILHCIPTLGEGGAERQLAYLAPELLRRGWDIQVACLRVGPNLERLTRQGVKVHRLPRSAAHDPRLLADLVHLVGRLQPQLIQTWLPQMDLLGGVVARYCGVPWVLSERSSRGAYARNVKNRLRTWLGRTADVVVANSAAGLQYWSANRPPNSLMIIPNGLPLAEIAAAPPVATTGEEGPGAGYLLVHVGRLVLGKNVDRLVEAMQALPSSVSVRAAICGDGPLRHDLAQQIQRHGLNERVSLLGSVSNVWGWLKRADLFVSLSAFEGRPNAVMEAMACRCPIVASDIPAHRELLGDDGAAFVDPQSVGQIAAAVQRALASPVECARRADQAFTRVQAWDLSQVAGQYHQLYREVTEDRCRRAA